MESKKDDNHNENKNNTKNIDEIKKTIIYGLIIFLILLTIFTFTEINVNISENLGLRIRGYYIEGDFYRSDLSRYDTYPQYDSFLAYGIIGIIAAISLLYLYNGKKKEEKK